MLNKLFLCLMVFFLIVHALVAQPKQAVLDRNHVSSESLNYEQTDLHLLDLFIQNLIISPSLGLGYSIGNKYKSKSYVDFTSELSLSVGIEGSPWSIFVGISDMLQVVRGDKQLVTFVYTLLSFGVFVDYTEIVI